MKAPLMSLLSLLAVLGPLGLSHAQAEPLTDAMPEARTGIQSAQLINDPDMARKRLCLRVLDEITREYRPELEDRLKLAAAELPTLRTIVEKFRRSLTADDRAQLRDLMDAGWHDRVGRILDERLQRIAQDYRTGWCKQAKTYRVSYIPSMDQSGENGPNVVPGHCERIYYDRGTGSQVTFDDAEEVRAVYWHDDLKTPGHVYATACRGRLRRLSEQPVVRQLVWPVCVSVDLLDSEAPSSKPIDAVFDPAQGLGVDAAAINAFPTGPEFVKSKLRGTPEEKRCPELLSSR